MERTVISVSEVYKDFKFSSNRNNTIKGIITGLLREKDTKEKTQHALKNISFNIREGEFFGIVGRNGSGKSTLLKIIAQIYQPNKGTVSVSGKLVPFIELGVGFNPELTGRENVYMNGAMLGFSNKEIDTFYGQVVEFAELGEFMDKKLKNYSSGMQVRLAFSMAIRAKADILLIDEVLAVGDADFQRKCFSYFRSLKREKKTVVFVSHDMGAIQEYCDRAILIEDSRIVQEGSPSDISRSYIKLFAHSAEKSDLLETAKSRRWGDGSLVMKKITMPNKIDESDKEFNMEFVVKANKDVDYIDIGYQIKDGTDNTIAGTNTHIAKNKKYSAKKGENLIVKWTIPNIFEDGKYYIETAIAYENGIVADWWEMASSFVSHRVNRTPFRVSPLTKCEMQIKK